MLSTYIETNKKPFEKVMFDLIESEPIPSELKESMLYSLKVGGKRLRPILLFAVLESFNLAPQKGYQRSHHGR